MMSNVETRPTSLHLEGGQTGVLLLHGFTGSTSEMSLIGPYLHEQGFTILAPLLPGHGTCPEDLNRKGWRDWVNCVRHSWEELSAECHDVLVGGLSLGALLSLYAAASIEEVRGVFVFSPPMPLAHPRSYLSPLKYLLRSLPKPRDDFADPEAKTRLWDYDVAPLCAYFELVEFIGVVKSCLDKIRCPILVVHSTRDSIIHPNSAKHVLEGVRSSEKDLLTLQGSGHVVTLDAEWLQVAERTAGFIRKLCPALPVLVC